MEEQDVINYVQKAEKEGRVVRETHNTITYLLITEEDSWVSIIEVNPYRGYIPLLQASNMSKARDWCIFREPIPVQINKLI